VNHSVCGKWVLPLTPPKFWPGARGNDKTKDMRWKDKNHHTFSNFSIVRLSIPPHL
jgi:hypothetical protein